MPDVVKQAAKWALEEAAEDRTVLILVPHYDYFRRIGLMQQGYSLTHPMPNVFVRNSQAEPGLMSLEIDTLIIVGGCDYRGVRRAKQRMHKAWEPRIYEL